MTNLKKKIIISCSSLVVMGGVLVPIILTSKHVSSPRVVVTSDNCQSMLDLCKKNIILPDDEIKERWNEVAQGVEDGSAGANFMKFATPSIFSWGGATQEFLVEGKKYSQNIFWEILYGATYRVANKTNTQINILGFDENTPLNKYTNIDNEGDFFNFTTGWIECLGGTSPGLYSLSTNEWFSTKQHSVLNADATEYVKGLFKDLTGSNPAFVQTSLSIDWYIHETNLILALEPIIESAFTRQIIAESQRMHSGFTTSVAILCIADLDYDINTGALKIFGHDQNGNYCSVVSPTDDNGNIGYQAPFYFWEQYDDMMYDALAKAPIEV